MIEQVIGQPKLVADASSWISKGDMPNAMFYGAPGLGKTSIAHVLANAFLGDAKNDDFLEINASQDRKLETVRETIGNFVTAKSYHDSKFKIVLLDEIEGMTRDSQRALKRTMERSQNCRFIITCNDPYGVDSALRSRCANYLFRPFRAIFRSNVLHKSSSKSVLNILPNLFSELLTFVTVISVAL